QPKLGSIVGSREVLVVELPVLERVVTRVETYYCPVNTTTVAGVDHDAGTVIGGGHTLGRVRVELELPVVPRGHDVDDTAGCGFHHRVVKGNGGGAYGVASEGLPDMAGEERRRAGGRRRGEQQGLRCRRREQNQDHTDGLPGTGVTKRPTRFTRS